MSVSESEAAKIIMDAMRDAIREVIIKPLVAEIIAGGYGPGLSGVECCHRTRLVGAPCPVGRTCPHDGGGA